MLEPSPLGQYARLSGVHQPGDEGYWGPHVARPGRGRPGRIPGDSEVSHRTVRRVLQA
jgi:hypothetical protein